MTALTIYRKHPEADAYSLNGGEVYTPYAIIATQKRFTTAEILAQYWFSCTMGHSPVFAAVLWRFAALPDYDQEETP